MSETLYYMVTSDDFDEDSGKIIKNASISENTEMIWEISDFVESTDIDKDNPIILIHSKLKNLKNVIEICKNRSLRYLIVS